MLDEYKREVTSKLATVQIRDAEQVEQAEASRGGDTEVTYEHKTADSALADDSEPQNEAEQAIASAAAARSGGAQTAGSSEPVRPFVRDSEKVGRNDPCPCGSGKKFKQCHGRG